MCRCQFAGWQKNPGERHNSSVSSLVVKNNLGCTLSGVQHHPGAQRATPPQRTRRACQFTFVVQAYLG
jgi:hypothetical protein